MKSAFLLLFLLFSCILSSQELLFEKLPFQFYSPSRKLFVVVSGDTIYTVSGKGEKWQKKPIHWTGGLNARQLESGYFSMSTSKADYFIMAGCGKVWQWKGDSLVRIDRSFDHKNQYGACTFVHHDTLFMMGGYGFFQTKNITTYFDERTGGWFLKHTRGQEPPQHSGAYYFKGKKDIMIWGGERRTTMGDDTLRSLWNLNLISNEWRELGKVNPEIQLPFVRGAIYVNEEGSWAHLGNRLLKFDVDNAKILEYKADQFYQIKGWVTHANQVMIAEWRHDEGGVFIWVDKISEVLGYPSNVFRLIEPLNKQGSYFRFIWALILYGWMLGVLGYYWVLLRRTKRMELLDEAQANQIIWSDLELMILQEFWNAGEAGLEVSDLNIFFNHGDPNFDTLKKRRELKLKDLRRKLAFSTGISEADIFQEERLVSDRRVKKMVLNESIKREKLGIPLSGT